MIISLYNSKEHTINEIIKMTDVSKGTIYNVVNNQKFNIECDKK